MTESRLDPNLIARLDQLRERADELLDDDATASVLALAQRLDRLAVDAHRGDIDSSSLAEELSSVADAFDEATTKEDTTSVEEDLILETVPTTRRGELSARNQSRLVSHAIAAQAKRGELALAAVQDAVLEYARSHRSISDDTPSAGQMQRQLSRAVTALVSTSSGEDVAPARPASTEIVDTVPSSGRLQDDLLSLMRRVSDREQTGRALADGDMVLAQGEESDDGTLRVQRSHAVKATDESGPSPADEAPDQETADTSAHEALAEAASVEGQLQAARARLRELRTTLQSRTEDDASLRTELEAQSRDVARLQDDAITARQRVAALRQQAEEGAGFRRASSDLRQAAHHLTHARLQALGRDVSALGRAVASIPAGSDADGVLSGARAATSDISERIEVLSSAPDAQAIVGLGEHLRGVIASVLDVVPDDAAESRAQLESLRQQVHADATEAAVAARATEFAIDTETQTPTDTASSEAAQQEAAVAASLLDRQIGRYEQATYATADLQERVLAAETLLDEPRTARRTPRAAELATPTAQGGSVQVERVDYSELRQRLDDEMRELRGLDSLHRESSVDLFSDEAGLELAGAARAAMRSGDSGTLAAEIVARTADGIRREVERRAAAKLARSAGRVASTDAGRRDVGLPTPGHFEYAGNTPELQMPLFKRKTSLRPGEGAHILPSLYAVAGLGPSGGQRERDPVGSGLALRKADPDADGPDLTGANLNVIQALETTFGNLGPRGSRLSAYGERSTKEEPYDKEVGSAMKQAAAAVSQFVSDRHMSLEQVNSTKPQDKLELGQMRDQTFVANLTSEAKQLPTSAREKLTPYLGTAIGDVKIYAGQLATMAAAVFGAKALTIGKHIFVAEDQLDFDSPEGLALLAHELVHTKHWGQGSSVEAKEQEAEAMEERVKKAFGSIGSGDLAEELPPGAGGKPPSGDGPTPTPKELNQFAVSEPLPPNQGGPKPSYDPELVVRQVYKVVMEMWAESAKRERERKAMT